VKRIGPELKKPEMKVPPILRDLYLDLRDRRLLPLLGLVLVAIVAVPFLLAQSPEEAGSGTADEGGVASSSGAVEASALTVSEARPGLRDYRRRLRHRKPTDPFEQRYTAPMLKGAELQSESKTSESSSSSTTEGEGSSGAAPAPVPPSSGSEGGGGVEPTTPDDVTDGGRFRVYTFTMKVQISRTEEDQAGNVKMGAPTVREGVRPLTPLPGEKAPVVTYLGASIETGKAIFMISKDVTAAFGDAKCIAGTGSCELMEIEPGFPETFEYGANQVRYKFNVLKLDVVRAGKR
jgi:hypothetical protein